MIRIDRSPLLAAYMTGRSMSQQLILALELESALQDWKRAISAKLYYPALLVALTIPDICRGLELPRSEFVKRPHYVSFVDKYTTPAELGLGGEACFMLRGGLVHKAGLARHPHFDGTHVIFTLPDSIGHTHAFSIVMGDKKPAMFDLLMFCNAMDVAARKWYVDNRTNKVVEENLAHLIRFCPFGLSP